MSSIRSLDKRKRVKYSRKESDLLDLLKSKHRSKPIATTDLLKEYLERFKPNGDNVSLNEQQAIVGSLQSLRRKVALNREPFVVMHSERRGPHPMKFWIEKRKPGE